MKQLKSIPFYKIKQAVKIINKNDNTNKINSKNLLSISFVYDLNLYVYFKGSWDVSIDFFLPFKKAENPSKYKIIEDFLLMVIECEIHQGVFLKLSNASIRELFEHGKIMNYGEIGYPDFLPIKNIHLDSHDNKMINQKLEKYGADFGVDLTPDEIDQIKILSIYPLLREGNIETTLPKIKLNKFEIDGEDFFERIITKKDLYLTNSELEKIINSELDLNKNITNLAPNLVSKTQHRGVSKQKIEAKNTAKILADYLWNTDSKKVIRTKEMSINIYAYLNGTEHQNELPEYPDSLSQWIKEIAEKYPYATQSGRPPKKE